MDFMTLLIVFYACTKNTVCFTKLMTLFDVFYDNLVQSEIHGNYHDSCVFNAQSVDPLPAITSTLVYVKLYIV